MRTNLFTRIQNLKQKRVDIKKRAEEQLATVNEQLLKCTKELAERIASGKIDVGDIEIKNRTESKPKRKRQQRKSKTADTGTNPAPQQAVAGQTPAEPTDLPPKAAGKAKRTRRTKAQIEAEKKAAENHKPLYKCEKGHEFEVPKVKNGNTTVCPECETPKIYPIE